MDTRALYFILLLLSVSPLLKAQEAIITDRPSQSEGTFVIPAGSFQIESGVNYSTGSLRADTSLHNLSFGSLFRTGITDGLELRIVAQPMSIKQRTSDAVIHQIHGMADLQLGLKLRVLESTNENTTSVSLLTHLILPTGSEGLTTGEAGLLAKIIVNQNIGSRHNLLANIGYENLGLGDGSLLYSLMWGVAMNDKLGLFLEPYGRGVSFSEWLFNADAGFTYRLTDNIQVDYTFGVGINNESNFHMAGLSVRLAR